jgi:deoxycytidylate deaminase
MDIGNADATTCKLLDGFKLHGWQPDPKLSDDENYMDLVMLLTRSSHCRQGSMACILVHPDSSNNICGSIISAATNLPLFTKNDSDVHAETAALGGACRTGSRTENATAYITMPPCKRCFGALVASGIKRIVTRLTPPQPIEAGARRNGIELIALGKLQEQTARINTLIHGDPKGKKRDSKEDGDGPRKRIKENDETANQKEEPSTETPDE